MNPHLKLAAFGRELLQHSAIEEALPLISSYAKELVGAERCSLYIFDTKNRKLWTTMADGVERISIGIDQGLAGKSVREGRSIVENDPYTNPDFLQSVDEQTGFVTQNVASIPIFASTHRIIGVMQLLNKPDGFEEKDVRLMVFFAHYVSGYLELSTFLQEGGDSIAGI
ncbi:MAG: GAF domain-containing protein [Campylobacterales bacterium]|nr:GAF domain-containing protein [Campylobacterales bacterium]